MLDRLLSRLPRWPAPDTAPRRPAWGTGRPIGEAHVAIATILGLALVGLLLATNDRPGSISGLPLGFFLFAQLSPLALLILAFWLIGRPDTRG